MSNELEHKQAAIVIGDRGATGGAIAKHFAREGMIAFVVQRSVDKLQRLVEAIQAGSGKAVTFRGNPCKEEEVIARDMGTAQKDPCECTAANTGLAQLDTLTKNFAAYFVTRRGPIKAVMS